MFVEVGRGKTFKLAEAQNSCLLFQIEVQLQAAQLTEASYDCTLRLANAFQFIFVTSRILPSLSHYILDEIFEERQQRTR